MSREPHMNESHSWWVMPHPPRYVWVLSHVGMSHEPHVNVSRTTYQWVPLVVGDAARLQVCLSRVSYMNNSRTTYKWVNPIYEWFPLVVGDAAISQVCRSRFPYMNQAQPTYEWVMNHIWMSPTLGRWCCTPAGMYESCPIHVWHVWGMNHIWMSHEPHINEFSTNYQQIPLVVDNTMWRNHVPHWIRHESHIIYFHSRWVTPHTRKYIYVPNPIHEWGTNHISMRSTCICTYIYIRTYVYIYRWYICIRTYIHTGGRVRDTRRHRHPTLSIYICTHAYTHEYMCICMYVCIYIYIWVYMHTCIHICGWPGIRIKTKSSFIQSFKYVHMHTHIYIYEHICVFVYIYMCMYTYIHTYMQVARYAKHLHHPRTPIYIPTNTYICIYEYM